MRETTLAIIVLLVIVGGFIILTTVLNNPVKTAGIINNPEENQNQGSAPPVNIIEITSSGFAPSELTVSKGTRVTWTNKDAVAHWPASAVHPTHTVYPGSNIEKCGTSEQSSIFDACHGLAPGESWSFTFNEVGSWGYHDHLNVNLRGKIVVQ